jgi:hypothetical protein
LLTLARNRAHTLILKPQALIDRGLAPLLSRHLLLFCNEALAICGVGVALGLSFSFLSGELVAEDGLLAASLLLLHRCLVLLLVKLLICSVLLLLKLLDLALVVAELGRLFLGFMLRCLLSLVLLFEVPLLLSFFLGLLLLLSRSLLLLSPLLLQMLLLLLSLVLLFLGPLLLQMLLLLLSLVLLLLSFSFFLFFFFLLLGRLRLCEDDFLLSLRHAGNHNERGYGCQQKRHDLHG